MVSEPHDTEDAPGLVARGDPLEAPSRPPARGGGYLRAPCAAGAEHFITRVITPDQGDEGRIVYTTSNWEISGPQRT